MIGAVVLRACLIWVALMAFCGLAVAGEPPCWPKQLGSTGSDFKQGKTTEGVWLGWTCQVKGKPVVFGVVALTSYQIKHPDITGLTPTKAAGAYYRLNVAEGPDPRLVGLQKAMQEAFK